MQNTNYSFTSTGITDIGSVRSRNEDSILLSPETGLWVVADGAGGHSNGDVASKLIVENLLDYSPTGKSGNDINAIYKILDDTNSHLIEMGDSKKIIGSTITAFISNGKTAFVMWAGDSPLFLLRKKQLTQVIEDHNRTDEFIQKGFTAQECSKISQAQQLTRAVGAALPLAVETRILQLKKDDLYLICSDGLTKELTANEIEKTISDCKDIETAREKLLETTLSRGARDNISIILIKVDASQSNQDK